MDPTTLARQLQAARPDADVSERRLEALVASRLFGPEHAHPPRVGRFTLLERIGRGGMGEVYAAHDPLLDRKVALKLLRGDVDEAPRRLLDEARAAARLAHPNVVAVLEVGELDDGPGIYVVMELIAGVTLRSWLRPRRSLAQVLHVFHDAGRGLAAAHAVGLLHRDFKPENVLVCGDDEPRTRVVDFGLARPLSADEPPGPRAGTPAYMAPEQLLGRALDARADQFSFCVALHEALTGRHPFGADEPGTSPALLLARIRAGELRPGERPLPAWLRQTLHRGLRPDPADRHPALSDLLRELQTTPARRRRRTLIAAGLGLGLACSAVASLVLANLDADPCGSLDADLAALWGSATRDRAGATLLASGLPDATGVWQRLAPRIDDAAAALHLARQQTCRARHPRGPLATLLRSASGADLDPADDVLRLRELCLLRRRAELAGVTALLREPDHETLLATIAALDQRTPLAACDDPESLRRELDASDRLVPRETVLHQLLALQPRVQGGAAGTLLPEIQHWSAHATVRDDPGLYAHALRLRGLAEEALGQHDAAADTLTAALHEALAARHDRLHAELAVRLVWTHGVLRRDQVRAAAWVAHAEAALRAIGGDPILVPRLLDHRGAIASLAHDHAAAERLHREAIARRGPAPRPAIEHAMSTSNLGLALLAQGQVAAAESYISAALERYRDVFGHHHPTVAAVLSNLGQAHIAAGHHERGIVLLRDALALKESTLGRDHLALLTTLNNLGNAYSELGRGAEARVHYQRALAIGERELGPDSPRLEILFHNLAFEAWQLGDHAEVVRHSLRALALQRRLHGEHHPILAPTLELLARGQLGAGRRDEAAVTIEQALVRARMGPLAPAVYASVLLSVAWIRHHTGVAPQQVRPLADEAGRLLAAPPGPTQDQQRELLALHAAP